MEPGRLYRVTFKDCGLEGEFTAVFLGWGRYDWSDADDETDPILTAGVGVADGAEFALWDNGVRLGPVEGFWTVYTVD